MTHTELIKTAFEAKDRAYAPYSNYHVGAALLCDDGTVYTGCNVEGASYGNAICAERTALVKAISDGKRGFTAIAVTSSGKDFCTPCGICRQMLYEFAPDMTVVCGAGDAEYQVHTLKELLPHGFGSDSMA